MPDMQAQYRARSPGLVLPQTPSTPGLSIGIGFVGILIVVVALGLGSIGFVGILIAGLGSCFPVVGVFVFVLKRHTCGRSVPPYEHVRLSDCQAAGGSPVLAPAGGEDRKDLQAASGSST